MTKTANKFNSLVQIAFVEDIDRETAASYSGGRQVINGRINDRNNNPDIILYEDSDCRGASIGINASVNNGISFVGDFFNDKASSFKIIRGTWVLYADANFEGGTTAHWGPGIYGLGSTINDAVSSLRRVG